MIYDNVCEYDNDNEWEEKKVLHNSIKSHCIVNEVTERDWIIYYVVDFFFRQ